MTTTNTITIKKELQRGMKELHLLVNYEEKLNQQHGVPSASRSHGPSK